MYLVVSYWKAKPGKEAEFETVGKKASAMLRSQPGVVMVEDFKSEDGNYIAVHGYTDESTYQKLIHDPSGEFNRINEELNVDEVGEWIRSERGETLAH